MSERRDEADGTRAGTDDDERAGAAGRTAIAARDDDRAAVAGATRTPADERREIMIVLRIEEGSAQEKKTKALELKERSCVFFFFAPFSKTTTAEQGRVSS